MTGAISNGVLQSGDGELKDKDGTRRGNGAWPVYGSTRGWGASCEGDWHRQRSMARRGEVGPKLDENGRTENFAHPAAIELCKMFYYSGKDCLSIVNCLDKWESGYWVKVPFAGDTYRFRYSLIAGLANNILGNAYHGQRLRGWWLTGGGDGGLSGVGVAVTQGRPHGLF
ncbi:hypothetical protein EDB85DRAFT_1892572 [Lactarius pseudohatsudake]|nr:hypothetical protein EDB85DRAFT_1892572 [Lactarius pseudohatsudake]